MDNDVSAEFDRTAEYRGGKGVVDDKRQIVTVCDICKALDIEYGERGVAIVSPKNSFVFGFIAASISSSVQSWLT